VSQTVRVQYIKKQREFAKFVIADIDAAGQGQYAEQEPGEMRWRPFTPSPAERAAVLDLYARGEGRTGWARLTTGKKSQ
jgi:hypothetical protein